MIIDTHIHLSHYLFDNEFSYLSLEDYDLVIHRGTRTQLVEQMKSAGITCCIDPAIGIDTNQRILNLTQQLPGFVFAAVGVHPTRTFQYRTIGKDGKSKVMKLRWKQRRNIEWFSEYPDVVAIGETGLDYHYPRKEQHRLRQKAWFIYQLKLAHKRNLPVVLHIREADTDAIRILKKYRNRLHGGVCHCFSGSAEIADIYTGFGLKLGIGGALLMDTPKRQAIEQAVIQTPLESILLETDSPYVKPDCLNIQSNQLRKVRNTSLILPAIAERIAELKNMPVEEVLRVTAENAVELFKF